MAGTLTGAAAGYLLFGWSPLILLGVLVGFLAGQTIHGLVLPGPEARSGNEAPLVARRFKAPATTPDREHPGPHLPPPGSRPPVALILTITAWGLALLGAGLVSSWGWFDGEGAGLALLLIGLPVLAALGMLGGPTASQAARRALREIEAGERPESDRNLASLALGLSRLTTLALGGFLLWLLVRVNT